MLKTKNVSSKAIGSGITNIATRAIMPNGNSELIKFGPKLFIPRFTVCCISYHQPSSQVIDN